MKEEISAEEHSRRKEEYIVEVFVNFMFASLIAAIGLFRILLPELFPRQDNLYQWLMYVVVSLTPILFVIFIQRRKMK